MIWTKKIDYTMWPVGQGLFTQADLWVSTEKFRVVYDCGTFNSDRTIGKAAMAANEGRKVDLLVISHFHWDHISRIPDLLHHSSGIEEVWIPYLSPKQRVLFAFATAISGIFSKHKIADVQEVTSIAASPTDWFEARGSTVTEFGREDEEFENTNLTTDENEYQNFEDDEDEPPDSIKLKEVCKDPSAFDTSSDFRPYETGISADSDPYTKSPFKLKTWINPINGSKTEEFLDDIKQWMSEKGIPLSIEEIISDDKNVDIKKNKKIS